MITRHAKSGLFIGLMSGTSMDAVDTVVAKLSATGEVHPRGWHSHAIPADLKQQLEQLSTPGGDHLDLLGSADAYLGEVLADAVLALLDKTEVAPTAICAIGSHGQTVRHRPSGPLRPLPFTLQIGDPNIIAARTGIDTVADFRRADLAVGGEGAPLAPAFHQHVFRHPKLDRVIVNIGGIANISYVPADPKQPTFGFDTGPGNRLIDYWTQRHLHAPYDDKGRWAAQGKADPDLLNTLLKHSFFAQTAPKSTGREDFNAAWLELKLTEYTANPSPVTTQATLLALTVATITQAITQLTEPVDEVFICGGGASNTTLLNELARALAPRPVASTMQLGIHPDQVEALAFAWLAQRTLQGLPGNLPAVTGAQRPAILGAIYAGNAPKREAAER